MPRAEFDLMEVLLDFERVESVERDMRMEISIGLLQGNSG